MFLVRFDFTTLIVIDVFLLMFCYVPIFLTAIGAAREGARLAAAVPRAAADLGPRVLVCSPIAIAVIALFTNGRDWLIGGLAGVLTGPIAYLIFKSIYKGTKDEALEGSTLTPEGELTAFGAAVEGGPA